MSDNQYQQQKGADEIFCSSCGAIIKKMAEICPKCGVRISGVRTGNGISVASLVLGIVGLFFGGVPGILGLIFGIKGIKSERKSMAIAGIVLNSLQIIMLIIVIAILANEGM